MILTLDIGNTNITIGGFIDEELTFVSRIATDDKKTEDQYACELKSILDLNNVKTEKLDGAIICSVVPNLSAFIKKAVNKLSSCKVLVVSTGVKTGLNIKMDNPRQLGSDLVCSAVWVCNQKKLPAIIVDMGTATTFTALNRDGMLIGTSILPGVKISLDALKVQAAQLPSVSIEAPDNGVLGKNTIDAIRSGIVFGSASQVDGMVSRIKKTIGEDSIVYLTGGHSSAVAPYCEGNYIMEDNLILKGLNLVWKKNH